MTRSPLPSAACAAMPRAFMRGRAMRVGVASLISWTLAACSPAFNWRDAPIDAQLTALLPCKPDRAQRRLPLTPQGDAAEIVMAGCQAGGATFAVAHWPLLPTEQAAQQMHAWQSATRAQWAGAEIRQAPVAVAGASPVPAASDWQVQRRGANTERGDAQSAEQQVQIRWFASVNAQGRVTLYQATVLGRPAALDAAATFFDGLRLR